MIELPKVKTEIEIGNEASFKLMLERLSTDWYLEIRIFDQNADEVKKQILALPNNWKNKLKDLTGPGLSGPVLYQLRKNLLAVIETDTGGIIYQVKKKEPKDGNKKSINSDQDTMGNSTSTLSSGEESEVSISDARCVGKTTEQTENQVE